MTQPPPGRYLGITIDHGDSFDEWLTTWGADRAARVATKRGIIRICLEAGISGLAVGLDLNGGGLESVVKAARTAGVETWLGLPDQEIQGEWDSARGPNKTFPLEAALFLARDVGAVGIKVSVGLAQHAKWSDVIRWITPAANVAKTLGLDMIVEPLFGRSDDVSDRVGFLTAAKRLDSVRFAKLDVHDPQVWSRQYGAAFTPWLARSHGLEFPAFCTNLERSLAAGCAGTMVGAAVWGIRDRPLLSTAFTEELRRRLALLRNLVNSRGIEITGKTESQ